MPKGQSLHHLIDSCGVHEEGLPEHHLTIEPPEQYHEAERLARWAAGCWHGNPRFDFNMRAYRTIDVPAWRESIRG